MAQQLSAINIVLNANSAEYIRKLAQAQEQTKKSTTQIVENYDKMGKAATKSSKQSRMALQNLSYQVQDIAVQAQLGTNAFIILSQQGSQIASAFGPAGALVGGILAVGGAIVTTTMGINEQVKSIDELLEGYKQLSKEQQAVAERKVSNQLGELYEEQIELQIDLQRETKKLEAANKRLSGTGQGLLDNFFKPSKGEIQSMEFAITSTTAALQTLEKQIDVILGKRKQAREDEFVTADELGMYGITNEEIEADNRLIAKEQREIETQQREHQRKLQREAAKHQAKLGGIVELALQNRRETELAGAENEIHELEIRQRQELEMLESRYDEKLRATKEYEELITSVRANHISQREELEKQLAEKEAKKKPTFGEVFGQTNTVDLFALNKFREMEDLRTQYLEDAQQIRDHIYIESAENDRERLEREMELELNQMDQRLANTEEFEKKRSAIEAKYRQQKEQLDLVTAQHEEALLVGAVSQVGDALGLRFSIEKSYAMTKALLDEQSGISAALSLGFPAAIPAMGKVLLEAGVVQTAIGAISGQFHGGVDSVPNSLDNSSFLLKAGERVIAPKANVELNKMITDYNNGSGSGGSTTVNQNYNFTNGGDDFTKEVMRVISRQPKEIAAIAQKGQRLRPTRR